MDRLKQLEVELEDARGVVKGILAEAQQAARPLSADERGRAAQLTSDIGRLEAEIKLEEKTLAWARDYAPVVARPDGDAAPAVLRAPGGRRYAELFGKPKPSPFKADADFFRAIHQNATKGLFDPMLAPMAAMGEAVGSEGGFAVPQPIAEAWLDTGLESEVVRPGAQVFAMTADTLDIPGWDDGDHSAGSIAGFKAAWTAELAAQTDTTGKLRAVTLKALKLLVSTQLSNEMLQDGGQRFEDQLGRKLPAAVSWALDNAFINGTGAGQPLGLLADAALITITKEASQPATTFVLENALKMYERMYPGGYANAVWIINHSVVPQLYTMVVKVKNVAGAENVGGSLVPYFTVGANGQMRLLGLPIVVTEKAAALGTKGDVILADLTQYAIGLRSEVSVEASRHAGWSTDSTYYRAVVRATGMGTWNKVLTPKAGSTRSWVIVTETR